MMAAAMPLPPSVSATALIRRQSLNNAIASQHTSVDGKVAAHHKRPHRSILLSQPIGFVGEIGLIFPTIDENEACEA